MAADVSRLKDITVLYCEDEADLRTVTSGILKNFTKDQLIAEDGEKGLELFKAHSDTIDLVITDVNMPNMSGLEMAKEIKAININVPIIVATAFSNTEYLLEAIELGIDKYVLKPVNVKKLLETMSQSLLYHELRDLYTDSLTHLPSRNALLRDLEDKSEELLALIDIDKFSVLNELYGEKAGDDILLAFIEKLKGYFQDSCKIYRAGADKFVLLAQDDKTTQQQLADTCKVFYDDIDKFGVEIEHYGDIFFSVTVGIAYSSDKHAFEYVQRVVHKARKLYKPLLIYNPEELEQKEDIADNLKWIRKLKKGTTSGNFKPYFQPIADTTTGEIYKYEALIRYIDKDGSEISPFVFLPIAKKSKLFPVIMKIMLTGVINFIKEKGHRISINISYDDIIDHDTKDFVLETLQVNKDEAKLLDFEILESEEISDFSIVTSFIEQITSYGCKVGVDDFGAGYANFNMLEALNLDFVKIDGSLIKNIDTLPKQALIVETIISFCKKLDIKTVAEFVSSKSILDKTKEIGIDYAQGWEIGKPISAESI
jgi:diguanylate cyclase (GGDEF)-like protein